jgi:hypothetical protein
MSIGLLPKLGAVAVAAAFIVPAANASTILTFGQNGSADEVTAAVNGTHTQTTINVTNGAIEVDDIDDGVAVPFSAFPDLTAASTGAVATIAGFITQDLAARSRSRASLVALEQTTCRALSLMRCSAAAAA